MTASKLLAAARALVADKKGVTAVEYGVIAALIVVVAVGGITATGTNLQTVFSNISGKLVAAQ